MGNLGLVVWVFKSYFMVFKYIYNEDIGFLGGWCYMFGGYICCLGLFSYRVIEGWRCLREVFLFIFGKD